VAVVDISSSPAATVADELTEKGVDAEDMTEEIRGKVMRLNLDAVLRCCQAEAEIMKKSGYGKIINTASMSAHIVTPRRIRPHTTSRKRGCST